jgi:hypothetical protein
MAFRFKASQVVVEPAASDDSASASSQSLSGTSDASPAAPLAAVPALGPGVYRPVDLDDAADAYGHSLVWQAACSATASLAELRPSVRMCCAIGFLLGILVHNVHGR